MHFDPSAQQNDCLYEIISSDCLLEAWLNHVEFIDSCLHVSIYMNIRSLFVVASKYHTVHYVYAIYTRPDLTRLYGCSNPKLQIQIWLFRYSLFKKSIFFVLLLCLLTLSLLCLRGNMYRRCFSYSYRYLLDYAILSACYPPCHRTTRSHFGSNDELSIRPTKRPPKQSASVTASFYPGKFNIG